MRRVFGCLGSVLLVLTSGLVPAADEPGGRLDQLTITNLDGQEYRLTGVNFTTGTRRLAWLADPQAATPEARLGPVAVAFREPNSTTYAKGVLTLVPVKHLESVKYDYEREVVTLVIKGAREQLTGSLEYAGVNVLGIVGQAGGKTTTFTAGVRGKSAVKSVVFPDPLPVPPVPKEAAGKGWSVRLVQSKKAAALPEPPPLIVRNLKTLLALPGGAEKLIDGIPQRKGPPVPFDPNLKQVELLAHDPDRNFAAAEITLATGPEKVIAIPLLADADKQAGTLVGLLGEVDVGYKLFPLHTVRLIVPYERRVD